METRETTQDNRPRRPKRAPGNSAQVRPGLRRRLGWAVRSGKLPALLLAGSAAWLLYDALTSPRYVVREVQAEGNRALSLAAIRQIAAAEGTPIWLVRQDEIEARIGQSPYIEAVRARAALPDRLIVQVRERHPDVRWIHNGASYAVTWDGLVLDRVAEVAPASAPDTSQGGALPPLPPAPASTAAAEAAPTAVTAEPTPEVVRQVEIVDTTPNRELKPGDRVDPDALEVARRIMLRIEELPAPLQRIEWDAGLGVSLIVADGRQVVIGRSERLEEKLAILTYLLQQGTNFRFLDLRPTTPYYR
ncbi:cell division protein FtsQ/DivIB [Kallotenue papyrolyticum]|uniref:cell division protein FtsQ/DivIB n=1 Tax=Kallotenue papyrolyticum TaxID=1325125 RepID=UPI000478679F|nr:FtsQ-type POTRA domain-containing protein [Kallotenue papyrolyticum]